MALKTCPNCGKPLRPGARFCGNCGATIPEDHPDFDEVHDQPSALPCPNCGKPVRVGAKYCNACGKEIPQAAADATKPAINPSMVAPPTAHASSSSNIGIPAKTRQSPPPIPQLDGKPVRKPLIPILIAGLAILCLFAGVGGYTYWKDPFNWLTTDTQPPTDTIPATLKPTGTSQLFVITSITPPNPTPEQPLPSTTFVLTPTVESPLEGTAAVTAVPLTRVPVTESVMITPTVQPVEASPTLSVIIEDEFDTALNEQWVAWGNPRPTIRSGFGDSWLDLKAADNPSQAGVTARKEVPNSIGTEIEFEAQLNSGYPLYPVLFDWDPIQFDRGPDNSLPTVLHLEIQKARVVLQAPAANNSCQSPLDGTKKHIYLIKFLSEKNAALYLDDGASPVCELEIGIKPISGRISFTGTGWITRIKVSGAPLP